MNNTLDSLSFDHYAAGATCTTFLNHYVNDEVEGMILFRFGDMEVAKSVLEAVWEQDRILSHNYYMHKQAEKGRMSEESASRLCDEVQAETKDIIAKHGPRLFEVVTELRAEWDCSYNGPGFDYLDDCNYKEEREKWFQTPEGRKWKEENP